VLRVQIKVPLTASNRRLERGRRIAGDYIGQSSSAMLIAVKTITGS